MTIKRVLLPVAGSVLSTPQIETAVAATKALNAHLEALYIEEEVRTPASTYTMSSQFATGVGRTPTAAMADAGSDAESLGASRRTREQFASACEAAGLRMIEEAGDGTLPAASWREVTGSPRTVVAEQAAGYDLVVAASGAVADRVHEIAEAALLEAGRPVMLAPTRLQRPLTDEPMIAWAKSPVCWHAVSAALPFLEAARHAHVVAVDKDREAPRGTLDRVVAYLHDHGIEADATVSPRMSRSVGEAILSEASENGGGMLVMGAYSHSPWTERLFGGATRHVLRNAAATPVLLAH